MSEDFGEMQMREAMKRAAEAKFDGKWDESIARIEKMAEENPAFAEWFSEFCAEQERLLRDKDEGWDPVIVPKAEA